MASWVIDHHWRTTKSSIIVTNSSIQEQYLDSLACLTHTKKKAQKQWVPPDVGSSSCKKKAAVDQSVSFWTSFLTSNILALSFATKSILVLICIGMFWCNFMLTNSFSKFIVSTGSFGQASWSSWLQQGSCTLRTCLKGSLDLILDSSMVVLFSSLTAEVKTDTT